MKFFSRLQKVSVTDHGHIRSQQYFHEQTKNFVRQSFCHPVKKLSFILDKNILFKNNFAVPEV